MRIVIFGGTTEGRCLSHTLARMGAQVTVCVATPYGAQEQGEGEAVRVLVGRRDAAQMEQILSPDALCVDATHPYAREVGGNIRTACKRSGAVYLRLLREKSPLPPDAVVLPDAAAAARWLDGTEGNILLTTGAKELGTFSSLGAERIYARVLPMKDSLNACAAAGIAPSHIIALQGPFSRALNEALLEQFSISYMVTKDGGAAGGFREKADAAQSRNVTLIVLRRPEENGQTYEEIVERCREWIKCK